MENPLKNMEYPGRGIILGRTRSGDGLCAYFITGRSKSSQARKLVYDHNIISTEPTNPEELAKGNPDLLLYHAIMWHQNDSFFALAVSNGKQTDSVLAGTVCGSYRKLSKLTRQWNYEPDEPNYTPRISGRASFLDKFDMEIIKRGQHGEPVHTERSYEYKPGIARLLTTYTGENRNPLPGFEGEPLEITITERKPEDICEEIGDMLNPGYRVSVATVLFHRPGIGCSHAIRNYRE